MDAQERPDLLGQLALDEGLIDAGALAESLDLQRRRARAGSREILGEILVASGHLDKSSLKKLLAKQRQLRAETRPYFGVGIKATGFAVTFALFMSIQVAVVWYMYARSRAAVRNAIGRKLTAAADVSAYTIGLLLERNAPSTALAAFARRVRESNRLDDVLILDREAHRIGSASSVPEGEPASAFAATPSAVRHAFMSGQPVTESVRLLGDRYVRLYEPVSQDGQVRAVLCLDAYDPLPDALRNLAWPLWSGVAVSAASALVLAVLVVMIMRFFDHSKREMLRVERLAAAGKLAAAIAHEVKNPMSIVLSTTQLIEKTKDLDEHTRGLMRSIEEEIRRADDHLDAFLDLTRDMPLRLAREDMRDVVAGVLRLFEAKAKQFNVRLVAELPEAPVRARVDRRRLRQALFNLCLNALEALEGSGGTISISVGPEEDDPSFVHVAVTDDGPGMPEDVRSSALEPFFSTKSEGTGLGLPRTKMIVERHGGTLTIAPAAGRGTTVTMRIPRCADADPDR